jgi:hypothetical protein
VLHRRDKVVITATGVAHFGQGPIASLSPEGIPQGRQCLAARAVQRTRQTALPAPTLNCFSLIGTIGSSPPFQVGRATAFTAKVGGELSLGVNDDFRIDNSGGWSATIRRTAAPTSPTTAAPPSSASTTSKKSSNFLLLAAGAALIIVALLLLAFWLRRRRERGEAAAKPAPSKPARPAPVPAAAVAAAPAGITEAGSFVAPPEGESTAGNILEVTFSGLRSLVVGYNHFPDGTIVHWRITQNGTVMTGEFETDDRSAAQRDVTLPLEADLDGANPADVAFAWSVGGVPFNYAVRRNPTT